jgi:hypothetical protein
VKDGLDITAGSMAGLSLIAVTQILTVDHPDKSLVSAVCIFAVAIPLLVNFYMRSPRIETLRVGHPDFRLAVCYLLVLGFDTLGFALIFFHFGRRPGFLFVASFVAANLWFLWRGLKEREKTG